jgi:NAD(P)-dependent dehydrogenase (short-subunit alcohol dehydrogenase family)
MTQSLNGKTALVTGASRGLGRAIALRLAADGAAIGVNYQRRSAEADDLVAKIRGSGGRALALQADVSDAAQTKSMVDRMTGELGPADILVNNAGVLRRGDLSDFDYSEMDNMRRTNVDGVVNATRAVVGGMKERRFGRIVNLTSIAAHGTAMAGTTFYAATKAAVSLLTRRFAMELGPHGITVNGVAPGFIVTEMVTQDRSAQELQELTDGIAAKAMVRRVGRPEDIAQAVAFLVSPDSGFVTAQILTVDGGRMDYICHV